MSILQLTQTMNFLPPTQIRPNKRLVQPTLPGMEHESNTPPRVTNRQIAEVLSSVADLLESQNNNPYRIQAYRNAARGVLDLQEAIVDIIARGETLRLPGLGERLRARIVELVRFGTMTFQNGPCIQTLPVAIRVLMEIEHIGPYTAIRLHEELGIDSPEKLRLAAHQQRIRHLSGFGVRSEARLKKAAEKWLQGHQKLPLGGVA
jgi:DNA polymerase (family 10)